MLRIYRRFWQVNWAEQWQYRANLLMYLLYWLVSPIVYLSVWTTIARSQGNVNGLTANDFITYYLTVLVVDQLTSEITIHLLAYKIQDGTLSSELLRPVHPILTNTLMNNLAFKSLIFSVFIPVWLVLFLLFRPNYSGVSWQGVLLALPAFALGFGINFLLGCDADLPGLLDHAGVFDLRILFCAVGVVLRTVRAADAAAAGGAAGSGFPCPSSFMSISRCRSSWESCRQTGYCAPMDWASSGWCSLTSCFCGSGGQA